MEQREELIRRRAYERWEAEGCPEGRDYENWLQAERDVLKELETLQPGEIAAAVTAPAMKAPARKSAKKPAAASVAESEAPAAAASEPEAKPAAKRARKKA